MNAIRDSQHIRVYDAYLIKESLKEIKGAFYDADDKAWLVPFSKENAVTIALLGAQLDETLSRAVKTPDAGDEVPIVPMPIMAKPYQHQVRAFNFALRTFGIGGNT